MPLPLADGAIKSTNAPAALVELATLITEAEKLVPVETRPERVSCTYSWETGEFTIAATIPGVGAVDATGKPVITPTDYLP